MEERARKLARALAAAEHERDELKKKALDATGLAQENVRLKETIDKLRDLRVLEHAAATSSVQPLVGPPPPLGDSSTSSPLVAPPPRRHAGERGGITVGVFLDVANLSGAARRLFDRAINFAALLSLLKDGRRLAEARAYVIDKGSSGFGAFATALRKSGFKVLSKRPKTFDDGTMKADWDVGIAVEVLMSRDKLDVVVLGSGDGDFLPLVNALKQQGVSVEIAAFRERAASELLRIAARVFALDETVLEP